MGGPVVRPGGGSIGVSEKFFTDHFTDGVLHCFVLFGIGEHSEQGEEGSGGLVFIFGQNFLHIGKHGVLLIGGKLGHGLGKFDSGHFILSFLWLVGAFAPRLRLSLDGFDLCGGEPCSGLHEHMGFAALGVYIGVHLVQFGVARVGLQHLPGVLPDGELDGGLFTLLDRVAEGLPALESVDVFGDFNGGGAFVSFDLCEAARTLQDAFFHQANGFIEDDLCVCHGVCPP